MEMPILYIHRTSISGLMFHTQGTRSNQCTGGWVGIGLMILWRPRVELDGNIFAAGTVTGHPLGWKMDGCALSGSR